VPNLYLMSTTVIPADAAGTWELSCVTLDAARELVRLHDYTSAVGHQSTAEVMEALLGQPVTMNRLAVQPKQGDFFLCFKPNQRPPEGAILNKAQLEELGYGWAVMHYAEARSSSPVDRYRIGSWERFVEHITN
jgi:hypothetical protein